MSSDQPPGSESERQLDLSALVIPTGEDLTAFMSEPISEEEFRAKLKEVIKVVGGYISAATVINGVAAQTNQIIVTNIIAYLLKFNLINELLFNKYPEIKQVFLLDFQLRATSDPARRRYGERAKVINLYLEEKQLSDEILTNFYADTQYLRGENWKKVRQILLEEDGNDDLFSNIVDSYLNQVIAVIHKFYYDKKGGDL